MNGISPLARVYGNVEIGENSRVDDFCILTGDIKIGHNVHIGCFSFLSGGNGIVIEDYVGISPRVSMFTASDDYSGNSMQNPTVPDEFKPGLHRGPIILHRHVLIGAHAVILPGVVLGEGSAVGAFSMVDGNLDQWTLYAGVPARKIRDRSRNALDLQKQFEASL